MTERELPKKPGFKRAFIRTLPVIALSQFGFLFAAYGSEDIGSGNVKEGATKLAISILCESGAILGIIKLGQRIERLENANEELQNPHRSLL